MTNEHDSSTERRDDAEPDVSNHSEIRSDNSKTLESRLNRLWNNRPTLSGGLGAGHQLEGYQIRSPLGAGTFGVVYLADDTDGKRPVALKVPRPEVLLNVEQLNRFKDEAIVIAKLDHAGVVKLLGCNMDSVPPFIATQWCDGPSLAQWLTDHPKGNNDGSDWRDVVEMIGKVADALQYVHQQGISHRDLKPANILLDRQPNGERQSNGMAGNEPSLTDFTPRISDFGLSKLTGAQSTETRSSLIVGTPIYMSPEQLEGLQREEERDHKDRIASDIYSLGVILFELLTGRPPIAGGNYYEVLRKIRTSNVPRVSKLAPKIPRDLDRICAICLNQNPVARYSSAAGLADDLRLCRDGQRVAGKKISTRSKYQFWHRRQDWLSIAGWYTLTYCVLIGLWFTVTCIAIAFFDVVPLKTYFRMAPMAALILISSLIIPGIFGWLCLRGKRWAAWVGLIMNLPKVVSAFSGMIGMPLSFQAYYARYSPYLSFTVHLFIFVCALSQLILYVFAVSQKSKRSIEE